MAIENDAKVTIRGDGSGAQSAFKQVSDAAGKTGAALHDLTTKSLSGMQVGWQSVSGVLSTVMSRFTLVAAAVAGGAAVFKSGIDETVSFTKEVNSLSKVLGISASDATAWNVALGDIYQDSGALIGAVGKLNRVISEDEEKITSLGIKTRDTSGHLRSQGEIFQDVTKHISTFKEGIDRNIEGTRIFGKSWGEVAPLMKLTTAAIDDAKVKAEELGLTVTKEGQERVSKYRAAMNDVGDVMLALKNVIGQALLPVFTRLGEWFSSIGPTAVAVLRFAMQSIATVIHVVIGAFNLLWDALSAIADPIFVVGRALRAIVTGDFKTAQNELTNIFGSWGNSMAGVWNRIKADSSRTWTDISNTWGKGTIATPNTDGNEADGRAGKPKASRVSEWSNVLDLQKQVYAQSMLEQGKFMEWGAREESNYWASILERQDLSKEERLASQSKYYAAEKALRKTAAGAAMADFAVQLEAARSDYDERDRIAQRALDFAKDRYGEDSKEYETALKKKLEIAREHQDKLREIDRIRIEIQHADQEQEITEKEAQAQLEVELGLRTRDSLLEIKRESAQARLQIELDGLAAEQAAYVRGTVEYEQYEARIAAAKRKGKALGAENSREKTKLDAEPGGNVVDSGVSALGSSIDAIVDKGRSAGAELGKIWRQAGLQMIHELTTKPFMEWTAMWAKKLLLNSGFLASKNATEAASASVTVATETSTGIASIGISAARAAAGAYAAIAGIPYVGPVLAPVAAGVALAAVIALGKSMFSAEGGMDIGNANPIIQAHAKEMVLPAKYADVIRGMAEGGGGSSAAGGPLQINALDARSFERMLSGRQGDMLVRALARRMRNGN
jgi:hypothetical protein